VMHCSMISLNLTERLVAEIVPAECLLGSVLDPVQDQCDPCSKSWEMRGFFRIDFVVAQLSLTRELVQACSEDMIA